MSLVLETALGNHFRSRTSKSTIPSIIIHYYPSSGCMSGPLVFEVTIRGECKRDGRCGRDKMMRVQGCMDSMLLRSARGGPGASRGK